MFEDALKYPWAGEDNVTRIGIGGIILLLGAFIPFIGWIITGYFVDVIRTIGGGQDEIPPAFDDWGKLFVDGLKATVIAILYQIPAVVAGIVGVILFFVFFAGGAAAGGEGGGIIALLGIVGMFLFMGIATLLYLVALIAAPAGIAIMARQDSLGAAFSFGKVRTIAFSGGYLKALLVAFVVNFLIQIAASVLGATVVGLVLYPFLVFYGIVAVGYALGVGAREAAKAA